MMIALGVEIFLLVSWGYEVELASTNVDMSHSIRHRYYAPSYHAEIPMSL
jgi:hypothetical protein